MHRRTASSALLLAAVLLAASATFSARWDAAGQHQPLPRAVAAAADHTAATTARAPRLLGLLLAVVVAFALPALSARRRRIERTPRPATRPVRLRVTPSRGPPLLLLTAS